MRITIEIDEKTLRSVQKLTGEKKQSPAVARALAEYLEQRRRSDFLGKVLDGGTDYALSNEELEKVSAFEAGS